MCFSPRKASGVSIAVAGVISLVPQLPIMVSAWKFNATQRLLTSARISCVPTAKFETC